MKEKINKMNEEESEDPFEKAENEYNILRNEQVEEKEFKEDEDDIIQNIEIDLNELNNVGKLK